MGHGHSQALAQFEDGPRHGFEFHGAAELQILQHRSLMFADFFRAGDALIRVREDCAVEA
jgi:hypothetical protein